MKYWLLCFFAVFLSVSLLPILAANSAAAEGPPMITVSIGGVTQEISVEEYTLRVLIAQNESCKNPESQKALAVSARSCAMYFSLYGCKHDSFDACDDGNCCLTLGSIDDADSETLGLLASITDETKGQILTLGSMPAMSLFTRCASKGTRPCEEFPYLTAVPEDARCDIHKTEFTYEINDEISELLGDAEQNQPYLIYDANEKCEFAIMGGKLIDGEELAVLLELPTVEFEISVSESELTAICYGIGHGYGLNLCGSEMLAESGMVFEKILEIYFPKLELNKMYYN